MLPPLIDLIDKPYPKDAVVEGLSRMGMPFRFTSPQEGARFTGITNPSGLHFFNVPSPHVDVISQPGFLEIIREGHHRRVVDTAVRIVAVARAINRKFTDPSAAEPERSVMDLMAVRWLPGVKLAVGSLVGWWSMSVTRTDREGKKSEYNAMIPQCYPMAYLELNDRAGKWLREAFDTAMLALDYSTAPVAYDRMEVSAAVSWALRMHSLESDKPKGR